MSDLTASRDAVIRAVLPFVPAQGWTVAALRQLGEDATLFPGGPTDMVEAYIDLADRDMAAAAAPMLEGQKLSARVRSLIAVRLEQALPHREAVRRAAAILCWPSNSGVAARCTYRTVDAIWRAAGDTSIGVSWYTKRVTLAGVYASTLLFWLNSARDQADTLEFLDRRLAGLARIGKLKGRLTARFAI